MAKRLALITTLLAQLAGGLAPTPHQNHRRTRTLATPPETQAIAKPEASADDALLIESALAFARRTSPADAVDRASHRSRAAQLSEEELRAVLVGRGILEAAAADVPAGTLAELLGEVRAADEHRAGAQAIAAAGPAPREPLLAAAAAPAPLSAADLAAGVGADAARVVERGLAAAAGVAPAGAAADAARLAADAVADVAAAPAATLGGWARGDRAASARAKARAVAARVARKRPLAAARAGARALVRGSARATATGALDAIAAGARGAAAWAGGGVIRPDIVLVVVGLATVVGRGRVLPPLAALLALRALSALAGGDDDEREPKAG